MFKRLAGFLIVLLVLALLLVAGVLTYAGARPPAQALATGATPAPAGPAARVPPAPDRPGPISTATEIPPAIGSEASFAPADYGLPDTLAGYKILAVITSGNATCMPPGEKILVVQAMAPDPSGLPATMAGDLQAALRAQGITDVDHWTLDVVGPTANSTEIIAHSRELNRQAAATGCVRTHIPTGGLRTYPPRCAWIWAWVPELAKEAWRWVCAPR